LSAFSRETHRSHVERLMGFASLNPSYGIRKMKSGDPGEAHER